MSAVSDFQTLSADGNTTWVEVVGPCRISISNDFGSGTATIQARTPENAALAVAEGTATAAVDKVVDFPAGSRNAVRVNLASSSSPDLDVWVQGQDGK